jgi:hypothetical protein
MEKFIEDTEEQQLVDLFDKEVEYQKDHARWAQMRH